MENPAPFGYHGCYLRIDVSDGSVKRVPIPEAVLRQFLGGSGLGAWLLLREGIPSADAMIRTAWPAATEPSNGRPGSESPITVNGRRLYEEAPSVLSAMTA